MRRVRSVGSHVFMAVLEGALISALIVGLMAGTALAAKGGNKPGGGGSTGGSSSLELVLLNSTDGRAHYGGQLDFKVSTTATDKPYVRLNCYEAGVWVMTDSTGYYPDYPWPGHIFYLRWDAYHTPGAEADCKADLYYYNSSRKGGTTTLASISFHVYP